MRTIERVIVGAHIYSSDKKLFVALSSKGEVYPDTWKIPGGGVEEGEDKEQALIREVLEETGIDVSNCKIELVDDDMVGESQKTLKDTGEEVLAKMQFFTYKITLDKPADEIEVHLDPREFSEYRWVEISELNTLTFSPPSIELFTKLGYL
ncbi:NUDIX hydrolase [Acetobacteraceae bacterium]|nr:NUDIX hydrolase [Candidatus Parcubacteria bacterium]